MPAVAHVRRRHYLVVFCPECWRGPRRWARWSQGSVCGCWPRCRLAGRERSSRHCEGAPVVTFTPLLCRSSCAGCGVLRSATKFLGEQKPVIGCCGDGFWLCDGVPSRKELHHEINVPSKSFLIKRRNDFCFVSQRLLLTQQPVHPVCVPVF